MANQASLYCAQCGKLTLHRQESPNHVLHLLLTILLCGLWAFVWLILAAQGGTGAWRCQTCGNAFIPPQPTPQFVSPEVAAEQRARREAENKKTFKILAWSIGGVVGVVVFLVVALISLPLIVDRYTASIPASIPSPTPRPTMDPRTLSAPVRLTTMDLGADGPQRLEFMAAGIRGKGEACKTAEAARMISPKTWIVRCAKQTYGVKFNENGDPVGIWRTTW
jgi:hypothetical protein